MPSGTEAAAFGGFPEETEMEIMIPVWPESEAAPLAQGRLQALKGVSVAMVDDNMDRDFMDELEQQLTRTHGAVVHRLVKPAHNTASPQALMEQAVQSPIAVVGVALCGSCTSGSMLDAAALEKKGIHTVTVVTDTFERAARSAARIHGVGDIQLAVIPARKGTDTPEDQRAKARSALPAIVQKLLGA
jgi:hypothetical protein